MASGALYSIDARVVNSQGVAINQAQVVLTNTTNNETMTQVSNSLGEVLFELANLSSGFLNGDQISVFSAYGNSYDEQFHTIDTSIGFASLTLSLTTVITAAPTYASVAEVRRYAGVDTAEFSNAAVHDFIKASSSQIDEATGRTWKGIQTSTLEFFDGDGTSWLWLGKTDIQSVTAIMIDDDLNGTYTPVTSTNANTSSGAWVYKPEGLITLERNATINAFTLGAKTVRVTYTYGNKRPTEEVRQLCMSMVANMINFNADRQRWIDKTINRLKFKGPVGLN